LNSAFFLGDLTSPYTIHHLACSVYFQCLSLIPALVREWYSNQNKRIRDAVDRVTQKYVSPILVQQELDSASSIKAINIGETGSFAVKKNSMAREITAVYTIETSRVEICIRLPMNYPLSGTNIDCTHHIGFTKEQWSHWMLQLKTNLTQNVRQALFCSFVSHCRSIGF
jgi:E3 ubiquitin-protein ligase listerin